MTTIFVPAGIVKHELPRLLKELHENLAEVVVAYAERWLNAELRRQVVAGLGRGEYVRRQQVHGRTQFECQRCGSRWRRQFSRNGYRPRGLDVGVGHLQIELPRVRCECGGSVSLHLEGLRPRQRWGDDLAALVAHWTELGYSLREMKAELDEALHTSVGLRSLHKRFHALADRIPGWRGRRLRDVPPVVMLDAVWLTLMVDTDETRQDRSGRQRRVKKRVKQAVMIALECV